MKRSRPFLFASVVLAGVGSVYAQEPKTAPKLILANYQPPPVVVEEAPLPPPDVLPQQPSALSQAAIPEEDCGPCLPYATKHPRLLRVKCRLQASHWGYPEEFATRPFGSYTRAAGAGQIENGIAAQLTLYRYDFAALDSRPSTKLNTHGQIRLMRLAHTLSCTPYSLVIEYDFDNPEINDGRRQVVLAQLRRIHPQIADEQVILRIPAAYGLQGEEGIILQRNLLNQTQAGGSGEGGASSQSGISGGNSVQGGSSSSGMGAPISNSGTARY